MPKTYFKKIISTLIILFFFTFLFLPALAKKEFIKEKSFPEESVTKELEILKLERESPEETKKEIMPEFEFLDLKPGQKLKGKISLKGKVEGALSVEFYLKQPPALNPLYLGRGFHLQKNLWEFSWDTTLTPNGQYQLFAKIENQYGEYESQKIKVEVENEIPPAKEAKERLEKEIKEAKEDIEKEEEKIEKEKEEIKEKISQEVKNEQIKKDLKEMTEEFAKKSEEIVRLENKTKEMEKDKKKTEEEIKKIEKEIEKIQKIPPEQREKIKVIEEAKREKLKKEKGKKKKLEKESASLREKLERLKEEKEKAKKEIIEKAKPVKEKILPLLQILEEKIRKKEKIKNEKIKTLLRDSDKDGLSDEEEIKLGTNPFDPDSDKDGFLDGIEIETGFNPLKAGPADKIIYSDARKAKIQKEDIYYVERVISITLPNGQWALKIEGKGLPNSFVTIYIYSTPIVMVTKTDLNGNWSIVLDKPLADGLHEVYTTLTNNQGEIIAKSEPFVFEKSGQRIVAITVSGVLTPEVVSPFKLYKEAFIVLTFALIILAIGVALVIIGISSQRKKEKFLKR